MPPRSAGTRRVQIVLSPQFIFVVLLVLLGFVLPLVITRRQSGPLDGPYLVQGLVMVVAAGGMAHAIAWRPGDLMNFGFWIFTYIWMGLAPFVMIARNVFPLPARYGGDLTVLTSIIVLVGIAGYVIGSQAVGYARARPTNGVLTALLDRRMVPSRVVVLTLFSVALAVVAVPRLGGPAALFSSRQGANDVTDLVTEATGGQVQTALLGWGLSVTSFVALMGLFHIRRRLQDLAWWVLLFGIALSINVLANNPISQPRFWAGTVVLGLIFSIPALSRPRPFRVAAVLVVVAVLLVFPYSDYFRYEKRTPPSIQSIGQQFTTNGDFDAFEMTQTGVAMVSELGLQPRMILGPALFWVPRGVWRDKPGSVGTELAEYANYDFTLRSSPLWIESYVWGGPAVVLLAFLLLGALNRTIDRARRAAVSGSLAVTMVAPLAFFQVMVLRGSLVAVMAPLTLLLVLPPILTRRAHHSAPSSTSPHDRPDAGARVLLQAGSADPSPGGNA